jgi:hypothetical protein
MAVIMSRFRPRIGCDRAHSFGKHGFGGQGFGGTVSMTSVVR